jgi:hypothetical protein
LTAIMQIVSVLSLASLAAAHYTFPKVAGTNDWQVVRMTANHYSNGPVTDVSSEAIRCYQLSPGGGGSTSNFKVAAGGSLNWAASPNIFHPGPVSAYMAKVPEGKTAASWDGSGQVWFKVYQEQVSGGSGGLSWGSMNKASFSVPVPSCLPAGEYLYRFEHVALHSASAPGGAQFYISCAQLTVSGGGSKTPSNLVSFPGAYKSSDPGLAVNIYNARSYTPAGPSVFTC